MEFGSGLLDAKSPVDAGLSLVSFLFQGLDLPAEGFLVWETLPQVAAGEDAELDLRHIQPIAMFRRVVKLQPFRVDSGKGQDRTLRGMTPVECAIYGWC